ncbi:hypothetical protein RO3G_13345 [Rhizopus delemar RA 99-880]|uniref:Uncharacterized protein n=1 Tax=Rhizopus delemar (strain RA 99-880 / ATCC MYA-4621 / FGSC 9543 / NRRL 43880) TaxID=246409 RepID=I1CJK4_RHIO9|nr:hypothetical protein RO3G_13345 [Rhizopus delemar RA 99-880]|eukprot:EIE88634.1 hypothetical protein RO3G_13345 [Rhizopus delemar RA 99-880]
MNESATSSAESFVLLSFIYRDLDDRDFKNGLLLSERLFAMDNKNSLYRFLYATCLISLLDYFASYTLLKNDPSVPCLSLFAESCLHLANAEQQKEKQRRLLEEGVQAATLALAQSTTGDANTFWDQELSGFQKRFHSPSRSSIATLLGDLYVKLDNIRAAARAYWDALNSNRFKLSAYIKMCDIAPDVINFNKAKLPKDIFKPMDSIDLSLCDVDFSSLSTEPEIMFRQPLKEFERTPHSMPDLDEDFTDISMDQLRAYVNSKYEFDDMPIDRHRGEIEESKDKLMTTAHKDIKEMERIENYNNKHGLRKRPPEEIPKIEVQYPGTDEGGLYDPELSVEHVRPSRVARPRDSLEDVSERPKKKLKVKEENEALSISSPSSTEISQPISEEINTALLEGINRVIELLSIVATGYLYQSFYKCKEAALELQQLDDNQYNSARVLCIIGKAYYDVGEYESARIFFRQAFCIAPWYCDYAAFYSTTLWYLQNEDELNLLAYKMKDNKCHLYEAYIVAGNWTKCVRDGIESSYWFRKAISVNPTHYYAHALMGYEEWEHECYLNAKRHFATSMAANRRSYIGWFGLANSYKAMQEYQKAKVFLEEAIRLHPNHPVLKSTMEDILAAMER